MNAEDKRHGTYAGAVAHWMAGQTVCEPCRIAGTRYHKRRRWLAFQGHAATIPALGTLRRIQALQALGYAAPEIARRSGLSKATIHYSTYRGERVQRATADRISATYEELSMTVPEGGYAHRSRLAAARKGWVPPLAWDNIDDPDEQPRDWAYIPATRVEQFAELTARGDDLHQVCRALHVSPAALEKWADRNNLRTDFNTLTARARGDREMAS